MDIAERIKLVRGELSQDEFAKRLDIHKNSLGRYERGESTPGVDVAERICSVFGVEPQWLLTGNGFMWQGQTDRQEQGMVEAPPAAETARGAPPADWAKQTAVANERLWQMVERERELMKEIGELKAENAMLKERIAAREQAYRDVRDCSRMKEEDVGSEDISAPSARLRGSTSE